MNDPIGFFLTWVTYGSWLPCDDRGWIAYQRGWQLPAPQLELEASIRMQEDACVLNLQQRQAVEQQTAETCKHRGWILHAVNCRTNHIHVAVSGIDVQPKQIRSNLKAWATRCLREQFDSTRENWWAERGSVRYLWNDDQLAHVIAYIDDAQDRKERDHQS